MQSFEAVKEALGERLDTIEAGCLALIGTMCKEQPALGQSSIMKAIADSKDMLSNFATNATIQ